MSVVHSSSANLSCISLDSLGKLRVITDDAAGYYREKCMVCFDNQDHGSGVLLGLVYGDLNGTCRIVWSGEVTDELLRNHADLVRAAEDAACAIALCLVQEFTEFAAFEQASRGTTVDYYLANDLSNDDLLFNRAARLEVSGILSESGDNTVDGRIRVKRRRLKPEGDLPTYIAIVEFSRPWSKLVEP